MAFVRSWMSDALRAGLAGLAVPLALLAVLAVLALGGAFGGLSSLGQLFVGPRVPLGPPVTVPQATPTAGTGGAPTLPAIPRLRTTPSVPAPSRSRSLHRPPPVTPQTPVVRKHSSPGGHRQPAPAKHGSPTPSGAPSPSNHGAPPVPKPPPDRPPQDPTQQLITKVQQSLPQTVPQSPADAISTVQQLGTSISAAGKHIVSAP